jgi:hypothetical protein
MSKHRELKNAQQELNEAVGTWVYVMLRTHPGQPPMGMLGVIYRAHAAFEKLCADLEGPGAASARNTSIVAAHTAIPSKGSARHAVISVLVATWALYRTGMTCSQIEGRLRKSHQTISSAVNFAEEHGWIKDSGERRPTQFKRPAIVWVPTDKAIEQFRSTALEVC